MRLVGAVATRVAAKEGSEAAHRAKAALTAMAKAVVKAVPRRVGHQPRTEEAALQLMAANGHSAVAFSPNTSPTRRPHRRA